MYPKIWEYNINMQDLEKCSIYELRIIAKNLGVKSPTTKRHLKLVDEISKILKGDIAPNF